MSRRAKIIDLPAAPDLTFERGFWQAGLSRVAGLDEAGRGALVGPVVAAAVVLLQQEDVETRLAGVRDSKQMTPLQRERCAEEIREVALDWAVGWACREEIDRINIYQATLLAMRRAVDGLRQPPDQLLLDAFRLPGVDRPQLPLVKGDARSLSIAAASVLAKTWRDAYMRQLEQRFPGYGFARHKGYATSAHFVALAELGPCAEHRLSFAPMKSQDGACQPELLSEPAGDQPETGG